MHEEGNTLVRWKRAALHRDQLQMRDDQRAEKVRSLFANGALCKVRYQDATIIHRERQIEARIELPQDQSQLGRGCKLPGLVENGCCRFIPERWGIVGIFLEPEPARFRIADVLQNARSE